MKYSKPPLCIEDQIKKLEQRGLVITDREKAVSYLSNISYYRLRAYTYPFQDNTKINHPFDSSISLSHIISLYVFDRKFRLLVFDAIEKIEISLRTQIIYTWAIKYGSHWYMNASLFRNADLFNKNYSRLCQEINRSEETFIKHYRNKYTNPIDPPCWMSLEVSSFGLLSLLFLNLKKGNEKKEIASYYGLNDVSVLENWMHSLSNIRNICAHHSRLWNRRLTTHIKMPTTTAFPFLKNKNLLMYKIYPVLCCIQYLLNIISPASNFKNRLIELMKSCPFSKQNEMGFPINWKEELIWND